MNKNHELAIIGAGAAGCTAAIYAGRSGVKTVVFDRGSGGGLMFTAPKIENYPGFKEITGMELATRFVEHARRYADIHMGEEVKNIKKTNDVFLIETDKDIYEVKAVILSTGSNPRKLGVDGEEKLAGKGVSYCATCDGFFFRGKKVAVVGGGNTAAEEAIYLTKFAEKVYLVHRRDKLRADKILQKRLLNNKKIEVIWDTVPERIYGNNQVKGVILKNVKSNETKEKECAGVFIFVGVKPNTDFVKGWIDVDEKGFILTNEKMETSREGVFACGDVRSNLMKQVVVACSEGAQAAFMAGKYLEWKEGQ